MKKAKQAGQRPVTKLEAIELLQAAIGCCQQAGLKVKATNTVTGLILILPEMSHAIDKEGDLILRIHKPVSHDASEIEAHRGEERD